MRWLSLLGDLADHDRRGIACLEPPTRPGRTWSSPCRRLKAQEILHPIALCVRTFDRSRGLKINCVLRLVGTFPYQGVYAAFEHLL